ncbi:hypothetical protein, partial [Streptococcus pneumoniae]|uniref:hypothetical protein n=1 Tax=Streptococcus pneumoniae TaxID=1313 RepID=UPI0018B0AD1F
NGSLRNAANALLAAYNQTRNADLKPHAQLPMSTVETRIAAIGKQQLILLFDEAHHLGPRGLNMIKSLINSCPKIVVVAEFIP